MRALTFLFAVQVSLKDLKDICNKLFFDFQDFKFFIHNVFAYFKYGINAITNSFGSKLWEAHSHDQRKRFAPLVQSGIHSLIEIFINNLKFQFSLSSFFFLERNL